jgi:hypothetical protein
MKTQQINFSLTGGGTAIAFVVHQEVQQVMVHLDLPVRVLRSLVAAVVCGLLAPTLSLALLPDHPVITEVYQDAPGNDGPVGRDLTNFNQEFIEIYLPPLTDLALSLNKDALKLAFFEIEGDASSTGQGLANYRIDLPTFDLDPSNGMTGLPRPPSGILVLGWVDYVGSPPIALAGTPSTRLGLVNGGITTATDYTFIAINGAQFGGTTNFPVPAAISHLDLLVDPSVGKIEEGAAAYLLSNRDAPGYAPICGQTDPGSCNAFPDLPGGFFLGVASLLDGFATNDDANFRVDKQPYDAPTGDNIDLEFVLPLGGVYTPFVPQVEEAGQGHQRTFIDSVKTTEDLIVGNEDTIVDALAAYRDVVTVGGMIPTPGSAPLTTSAAEMSLADTSLQPFDVLAGTTAHPGLFAANIGGDRGMLFNTTPDFSSVPALISFSPDVSASPSIGQAAIAPAVGVTVASGAPDGQLETISVSVSATKANVADPAVLNSNDVVSATYRAIDPKFGKNALGAPFQATAFIAVHGLPDVLGVANEFVATSLGAWLTPRFGVFAFDSRGHGLTLLNPLTDLSDPILIDPMIGTLPDNPLFYINAPGAPGTSDLVSTVLGSAEVLTGTGTYDASFNATQTLLQAKEFDIIPATRTTNGGFTPTERIHYADALGRVGNLNAGLTNVETTRDFELMMIETNLGPTGVLETGETDDFGLVVRAAQVSASSPVAVGELIFLSMSGGLQGADVDTLNVPPGLIQTSIVYVDLDPLGIELGVETIDRVYVIDGSGTREPEFIDIISVPEPPIGSTLLVSLLFLFGLSRLSHRRTPTLDLRYVS